MSLTLFSFSSSKLFTKVVNCKDGQLWHPNPNLVSLCGVSLVPHLGTAPSALALKVRYSTSELVRHISIRSKPSHFVRPTHLVASSKHVIQSHLHCIKYFTIFGFPPRGRGRGAWTLTSSAYKAEAFTIWPHPYTYMVHSLGLEPRTCRLWAGCSNLLS